MILKKRVTQILKKSLVRRFLGCLEFHINKYLSINFFRVVTHLDCAMAKIYLILSILLKFNLIHFILFYFIFSYLFLHHLILLPVSQNPG